MALLFCFSDPGPSKKNNLLVRIHKNNSKTRETPHNYGKSCFILIFNQL